MRRSRRSRRARPARASAGATVARSIRGAVSRAPTPTSAWSRRTARFCREWLLQAPRLGMINVHASLLPKYRGAAPVHRAVMAGETETGVTIMRVVKALDAGPMLARVVAPDRPGRNQRRRRARSRRPRRRPAGQRASTMSPPVAWSRRPQDDADATYAQRLTKEEGLIDWSAAGDRDPQPRARPAAVAGCVHVPRRPPPRDPRDARRRRTDASGAAPGTCCRGRGGHHGRLWRWLEPWTSSQVQPEGRRVMSAREFLAGYGRVTGKRFG